MQESHQFSLCRIRFDSDSIQALSLSRRAIDLGLPPMRAPVSFTAMKSDGKFSNCCGGNAGAEGDAHVYCGDNPIAESVRVHASGKHGLYSRSGSGD